MKSIKNIRFNEGIYYYISLVYMELVLRVFSCRPFFGWGLLFMFVFAAVPTLLITGIGSFFGKKTARISGGVMLGFFFFIYSVQTVYHQAFGKYMIVYSIFNGGATQIMTDGVIKTFATVLLKGLPAIILMSLPLVLFFVLKKCICHSEKDILTGFVKSAALVAVSVLTPLVISFIPSLNDIRTVEFDADISVRQFGLIYTETLDIKYNVFKVEQKIDLKEEHVTEEVEPEPVLPDETVEFSDNISDIDFLALNENETDKALIELNSYFHSKIPTKKNKYTGMYKGYNLITVTAEGFSPYAVDPVLTPTLYKMSQEGFKFTNFYTPIWGVSTSDGEYAHCTGLIPKNGVWSFYRSGSNYMPYCLGNMFKSIGVNNNFAYHNNTYSYYHRDISHPNMGYIYKGVGNGLTGITEQWPQSDLEMINATMNDYISSGEPFHAYYMTVSGHLNYTKIGNMMAQKNWDMVKDLECSDELKAYYACNIELDKAMEALLKRLNDEGIADKTVITITPDHYPYGLEKKGADKYAAWRELLGHDVDTTFELYESNFILYCQGTKDAPTVSKYCYSVDILPTMLNLFGFEYDSRLLMGSDILSTAEPLVIFSDRSFITDKGKYNAKTDEFTLFDANTFADEEEKDKYVKGYRSIVSNRFQISAKMLEKDYYRYVFKK